MDVLILGNAKAKARIFYDGNKKIEADELFLLLDGDVLLTTCEKYLIEFRSNRNLNTDDIPNTISMSKLETELAYQLERNPNSTVIKSCIDFLKLKQMSNDTSQEIDMSAFLKKGKDINYVK